MGYARSKLSDEEFLDRLSSYFKLGDDPSIKKKAEEFKQLCSYVQGPYDEDSGYQTLLKHIESLEDPNFSRNRLFYLALPPSVFGNVTSLLKKNCYTGNKGHTKVIVEKPFGHDLESSRALQAKIAPMWAEDEVYRIDHYLGKEMVKNILLLRFGNQFFNVSWNKHYIASVQVLFKEPFGTEGRGGYFDEIGIIRDVIQNHLFQVLSLVAMERPVSFEPEDIRDEKVKVLRAIRPIELKNTLLGQYDKSLDGTKPAYTDDKTVPPGSKQVTYAALELEIQNERWEGVPFILRAGKALDEAKVEVRIQFKDVAKGIFQELPRNELVIRIQPREAIYLKMNAKYPGLSAKTVSTELDLTYQRRYSDLNIPEAYEALILDALRGDHSNFVRDDELDVSWKIFTPLLQQIEKESNNITIEKYPYGSRGPASLNAFLERWGYIRDETYQWPVTKGNL